MSRRKGYQQDGAIRGVSIPISTSENPNGSLAQVFTYNEGISFSIPLPYFLQAVSIGIKNGVNLEEYVHSFSFTRFEPSGQVTGNDAVKSATSPLDYIFRELSISYLGYDLGGDLGPTEPRRRERPDWQPDDAGERFSSSISIDADGACDVISRLGSDDKTVQALDDINRKLGDLLEIVRRENQSLSSSMREILSDDIRAAKADVKNKVDFDNLKRLGGRLWSIINSPAKEALSDYLKSNFVDMLETITSFFKHFF